MPTVPAANLPYTGVPTAEPQVGVPSRFQTERATPEDFGAGIGTAVSNLGQQIGRGADVLAENAIRIQDQHNHVAADDLTNQYQDFETKLLYGDPNLPGDTGFFGKKGQDALNAMPQVRDALLKQREQMRGALQNDRQKILFDGETRRLQAVTLSNIGRHFVSETNTYQTQVADAKVKSGLTSAAQAIARDDEAGFNAGVKRSMDGFLEDAQRKGLAQSPDYVNQGLQKIRGEAVKYKFESLLDKNPLAAREFLSNNIDAVNGDEANQLMSRARSRAASIQADVDNGFAEPPKSRGESGSAKGTSADLLGPYATGNAALGGPSSVEGVNPVFASRISNMVAAMPPEIKQKFNIISGYRSQERQQQVNPSVKNSHHTQGMAVDTTEDSAVINWINQNGARFGVGYTLNYIPNEQNHLEPTEGGQRIPVEEVASWAQFNGRKVAQAPDKVEVRNNNFGGIRKAGVTASPSQGGFESYETPQAGVQAIVDKLHKWNTEGVTTEMNPSGGPLQSLRQIISVWAPPTENDTNDLINRAVKLTGYGPDDKLNLNDPTVMGKVTEAIIRGEQGGKLPVSPIVIANAAGQAPGLGTPRPVQLASNDPDQIIPTQTIKPLPKLDFALPPLEPGEVPDAQLPGMAQQLEKIMQNVPEDEVERRRNAVKRARQVLGQQYQDQQRALRLHNEQTKAQATLVQDDYLKRMYPGAPNPPSIQEVLTDNKLREHPEVKRTLVSFMERENKTDPAALVSKQNTMQLFAKMNLPDGEAEKITTEEPFNKAYTGQEVTRADRDWLVTQFRTQRSAGGETIKNLKTQIITAAKPTILGPLAAADERLIEPDNAFKMFNFIHAVDEKIDEYQKAGKNPVDLFNPKKPDFVGSDDFMRPFASPMAQRMRQQANERNTIGPPVPAPGQTPAPLDITKIPDADLIQGLNSRKYDYNAGVKELERRGYGHRPAPPVR